MKVVYGDLVQYALAGRFSLIVHGCNCFCTMEAGIAKSIKLHFPEAYEVDCATVKGDKNKLGHISYAKVKRLDADIIIVNAYTQYHWRGKAPLVDYDALRSAFILIRDTFPGMSIAYPKIGAGLAGGDWREIASIIDYVLFDQEHRLVIYE